MINNNSKDDDTSSNNQKIKQFSSNYEDKEKDKRRVPYNQSEVDDLKNLLGGAYKNLEDNNETKKKFN